jgi:hypothetical protein
LSFYGQRESIGASLREELGVSAESKEPVG